MRRSRYQDRAINIDPFATSSPRHLSITGPRRSLGVPEASNRRIEPRLRSKKHPVRHHSRA